MTHGDECFDQHQADGLGGLGTGSDRLNADAILDALKIIVELAKAQGKTVANVGDCFRDIRSIRCLRAVLFDQKYSSAVIRAERRHGAGEGNRTLIFWMGTRRSTTELHPQQNTIHCSLDLE